MDPTDYLIHRPEIREELKPQNLSFTDIAKRVGERWQILPIEEKDAFESEAGCAKEKYNAEMARYKRTAKYREYTQYLADFKLKNGASNAAPGRGMLNGPSHSSRQTAMDLWLKCTRRKEAKDQC